MIEDQSSLLSGVPEQKSAKPFKDGFIELVHLMMRSFQAFYACSFIYINLLIILSTLEMR